VSNQESQSELCIRNRETHLSRDFTAAKSLLFVFDFPRLATMKGHPVQNCHCQFCSVENETVIRRERMKTTRGIMSEGNEGRGKREQEKSLRTFNFYILPLGSCPRKIVPGHPCRHIRSLSLAQAYVYEGAR